MQTLWKMPTSPKKTTKDYAEPLPQKPSKNSTKSTTKSSASQKSPPNSSKINPTFKPNSAIVKSPKHSTTQETIHPKHHQQTIIINNKKDVPAEVFFSTLSFGESYGKALEIILQPIEIHFQPLEISLETFRNQFSIFRN